MSGRKASVSGGYPWDVKMRTGAREWLSRMLEFFGGLGINQREFAPECTGLQRVAAWHLVSSGLLRELADCAPVLVGSDEIDQNGAFQALLHDATGDCVQ